MKRLFDFLASLAGLVLLAPLFLVIALAIALDSPGPVFFSQARVGRGLVVFKMQKFRSMIEDAARQGPYFTTTNDTRITRVGRWLRKTSIDELPQLWNVLVGDMSIVGPRPDVPAQQQLYVAEEWSLRHVVRPGITGPSQASSRSEATFEERKDLDLRYAQNHSFKGDLVIIARTFVQVLGKGGN